MPFADDSEVAEVGAEDSQEEEEAPELVTPPQPMVAVADRGRLQALLDGAPPTNHTELAVLARALLDETELSKPKLLAQQRDDFAAPC